MPFVLSQPDEVSELQVILSMIMAKGDRREVGVQDGGCFSRFLKRERINNLTFVSFPRLTLTLP